MLYRKVEKKLREFADSDDNKALLITGARQVGKTFVIRDFGKKSFKNFIEINFIENKQALELFKDVSSAEDIIIRISAISQKTLEPKETLIFFDEVQECKEIVTSIKFLVDDGRFKYILSGSLLGVDLKDIRSVPVGYMDEIQMYPLDLEEFAIANGVSAEVLALLESSFESGIPVDNLVHEKMMELFRLYLIVGGMPAVVSKFLSTNNLREVNLEQHSSLNAYKKDIAKYDSGNKLYLEDIFSLIPSELNNKNKRFILKDLNENFKFSRYSNSFLWLKDAGVALPTFCVDEPKVPLLLSRSTNLFKLFLSDVGLLAAMYAKDIQVRILNNETDINFGSIYENAAAQELVAHGFNLFYFNSKKQGELDFLIEDGSAVIPIEIKSGKSYNKHTALNNVMSNESYKVDKAYVFYNGNVEFKENVRYYPIYMLMFVKKEELTEDLVYKPDFSVLG